MSQYSREDLIPKCFLSFMIHPSFLLAAAHNKPPMTNSLGEDQKCTLRSAAKVSEVLDILCDTLQWPRTISTYSRITILDLP